MGRTRLVRRAPYPRLSSRLSFCIVAPVPTLPRRRSLILDVFSLDSAPHGLHFLFRPTSSGIGRVLSHPVWIAEAVRRCAGCDKIPVAAHAIETEFSDDLNGRSAPSHSILVKRARIETGCFAACIASADLCAIAAVAIETI